MSAPCARSDPRWIRPQILAVLYESDPGRRHYARQMPATVGNYWGPKALLERRSLLIARDFTYSALWMAYGAMLMVIGFWRQSAFVRWQALALIAVTVVKVFVYDTSQLDHVYRILSFIALGILLLAVSFAYQRNWLKLPAATKA